MIRPNTSAHPDVSIRPLRSEDLPATDQVMRFAFGTFLGVPDPSKFFGDSDYVTTRWRANPNTAFVAESQGEIVGSVFVTRWGSFAFFGPLTIRPDHWDRGIGRRLMEPVIDLFRRWEVQLAGLFTFPNSPKHLGLYQKFDFHPMNLTAVMGKTVEPKPSRSNWGCYSHLSDDERLNARQACQEITDSLFKGLDLTPEIETIQSQGLGDTLLLWRDSELMGFAACHHGPGTEAGSGSCFVKFGACRPSETTSEIFGDLLSACEEFASSVQAKRLVAGVNTSRREAYHEMHRIGFRTDMLGIAMHRPTEPGWNRSGAFVLDDWR